MNDVELNQSVNEIDRCINSLFDMGLTPMNINGIMLGRLVVMNRHFQIEDKFKDVLDAIVNGQVDDAEEIKMTVQ